MLNTWAPRAGDWGAAGERDAARPGAEDEDDGDAFGEFEDLETGKPACLLLPRHWCSRS